MSETSSEVFPSSSPSSCSTGTPRDSNCSMSSPCSLPRAATELKIVPMSCRLVPAMVAVSPMIFSVRSRSWPGLIPAATAPAAAVPASSRPKAVPFTLARALSMMLPTPVAECPRPRSFASACSMPLSRPKPFVRPTPSAAPADAPTPMADFFSTPPMPAEMRAPMDLPDASAALSTPDRALWTPGAILEVSGMMER